MLTGRRRDKTFADKKSRDWIRDFAAWKSRPSVPRRPFLHRTLSCKFSHIPKTICKFPQHFSNINEIQQNSETDTKTLRIPNHSVKHSQISATTKQTQVGKPQKHINNKFGVVIQQKKINKATKHTKNQC